MDDYEQKYQNKDFQQDYNEDIEKQGMAQNQEDSEVHNKTINQQNLLGNNGLKVPNPEGLNSPVNNQSEEHKENEHNNMEIEPNENTQINNDNNDNNELENMVLNSINENQNGNEDDRLNFYPELPRVDVNRTTSSYQFTENQATENNEVPVQQLNVIHIAEKSTDQTMKNN